MDSTLNYQQALAVEVNSAIERAGKSALSVAEGTKIPRTTLLRRLAGDSPLTVIELAKIATFIGASPVELLRAVDDTRTPNAAAERRAS
jgi:transcriptional regulator with XRE-family HTH domain